MGQVTLGQVTLGQMTLTRDNGSQQVAFHLVAQ